MVMGVLHGCEIRPVPVRFIFGSAYFCTAYFCTAYFAQQGPGLRAFSHLPASYRRSACRRILRVQLAPRIAALHIHLKAAACN